MFGLLLLAPFCRAGTPAKRVTLVESTHVRVVLDKEVRRIASGNPAILAFELVTDHELLLLGKKAGQTSLIIWFTDGTIDEQLCTVQRDLSLLQSALAEISSGIICEGAPDRDAVVLRGVVRTVRDKITAEDIAGRYLAAGRRAESVLTREGAGATVQITLPQQPASPQQAEGGAGASTATASNLVAQESKKEGNPPPQVIDLLEVAVRPLRVEERILAAIQGTGGRDVTVRRIVRDQAPDDSGDAFVLEGTVADQTTLVRALILAAHVLGANGQTAEQIRVVADEAGALATQGNGAGATGGGGGTTGVAGLGGGGGLRVNQIKKNVARGKILEVAGGRIVSFIEVRDLPQVRINVQLYEIDRGRLRNFSLNWSAPGANVSNQLQAGTSPPFNFFAGANTTTGPTALAVPGGSVNPVDIQNVFSVLNGAASNEIQAIGKRWAVQATLQFLESQNVARSLSSPTLVVLSGETADFEVGEQIPYTTQFATAVNGATGVLSNVNFIQTGVLLDIRPLVGQDDTITLDLSPSVSAPDLGVTQQIGTSTGTNQAAPTVNTRSLQTSTRLDDGQSLLLGGLVTNASSRNSTFTPFLNQIPIIEWLFKNTNDTDDDSELVIVVTPSIVRKANGSASLWAYPELRELMEPSLGNRAPH
jgi:Flp pilus assembly secretin CpaC